LIVDDNANMRKITATVLYALGIKDVREATGGEEAFAELKNFQADVVIVDWVMAPEDGIALTLRIRSRMDSPNPYLPIIMLTGHTEKERIEQARDAGVTEFLSKPVSVKGMVQRILNLIEKPRQFVAVRDYFGPDRRRHIDPMYTGPERRSMAEATVDSDA
jgi:CheY-like chemotaxis protein